MAAPKREKLLRSGPWTEEEDIILKALNKNPVTREEGDIIAKLHATYGNKWALMATQLPGRTDNDIKNYWNTKKNRLERSGQSIRPTDTSSNVGHKSIQSVDNNMIRIMEIFLDDFEPSLSTNVLSSTMLPDLSWALYSDSDIPSLQCSSPEPTTDTDYVSSRSRGAFQRLLRGAQASSVQNVPSYAFTSNDVPASTVANKLSNAGCQEYNGQIYPLGLAAHLDVSDIIDGLEMKPELGRIQLDAGEGDRTYLS